MSKYYEYTEDTFICPVCGAELGGDERLYLGINDEVIGCECCVSSQEVWEHCQELDEYARDAHEDYLVQKRLGK